MYQMCRFTTCVVLTGLFALTGLGNPLQVHREQEATYRLPDDAGDSSAIAHDTHDTPPSSPGSSRHNLPVGIAPIEDCGEDPVTEKHRKKADQEATATSAKLLGLLDTRPDRCDQFSGPLTGRFLATSPKRGPPLVRS
jgi:hypothetical protein